MNLKEALNILRQVCVAHKGILEDHQKIQAALQTIEKATEPVKKDKKK